MKKNKIIVIIAVIAILVIAGMGIYKIIAIPKVSHGNQTQDPSDDEPEEIRPLDEKVKIDVIKSTVKDNSIVMKISGLDNTYKTIEYEITYDSQGLIKGVNSGSKPIELGEGSEFERDVYLGTCSRNVCKPDVGVKTISVALEFADDKGQKSQYSGDFNL